MPVAALTQTIARAPHEVFAAIVDLTRYPQWNRTIASARKVSPGPIGPETVFEMKIRGFGQQTLTLRQYVHDRQVLLEPTSKMFAGGHTFVLTAVPGGTRIDHRLVMRPRGIFWLMWPMMALMSGKNLKETAADLEAGLTRVPLAPGVGAAAHAAPPSI